jgi:hypothetical protein
MRRLLLACAMVLLAVQTSAQDYCETDCMARVGEPVTVFAEAEPGASWYRIRVNGVDQFMEPTLVNGNVEFEFRSGLPRGKYTLVIELVLSGKTLATLPGELRVNGKWKG